jgi:hypothetical protein
MARRAKATEFEDVTHLAGWMYADLLLALMVIFLATISFVPRLSSTSQGVTSSSSAQTDLGKNYKLGLALVYSSFDPARIDADVRAFKEHESLSANSKILYAQITGGYASGSESAQTGRVRALAFSLKLIQSLPDTFTKAPTYLAASSKLKSNEIGLRLTFTEKVG